MGLERGAAGLDRPCSSRTQHGVGHTDLASFGANVEFGDHAYLGVDCGRLMSAGVADHHVIDRADDQKPLGLDEGLLMNHADRIAWQVVLEQPPAASLVDDLFPRRPTQCDSHGKIVGDGAASANEVSAHPEAAPDERSQPSAR